MGSDGWDRTSQLVSVASLLLDGHYRTISGIVDLIEKDWILPGHKFRERNGLTGKKEQKKHANEASPIFLQFLDAVAQIMNVFPEHFEYTVDLLSFLAYHALSGRYGTFLCNSQFERHQEGLPEKAPSIWGEVLRNPSRWENPDSVPERVGRPILPCVIPMGKLSRIEELYTGFYRAWPVHQAVYIEQASSGSRSTSHRGSIMTRTLTTMSTERVENRFCIGILSAETCKARWTPDEIYHTERYLCEFAGVGFDFPVVKSVRVTSFARHGNHFAYVVVVSSDDGRSHHIAHRYSRFKQLQQQLRDHARLEVASVFPPAQMFFTSPLERQQQLDRWMRQIVDAARLRRPLPTYDASMGGARRRPGCNTPPLRDSFPTGDIDRSYQKIRLHRDSSKEQPLSYRRDRSPSRVSFSDQPPTGSDIPKHWGRLAPNT